MTCVLVDRERFIVERTADLSEQHALRGYDAVHLATALAAACDLVMAADRDMLRAAADLGLATVDADG